MEMTIENHYGEEHIAQLYATYRPYYTQEVFDKIMDYHNDSKHCGHQLAVDVCCGSGRGTVPLTKYFTKVVGVDSSSDQLKYVPNNCPNLETRIGSAEDLSMFGPNEVDLLSIAMGLHYVNVSRFFAEVQRILKPSGTFVAYGYAWDKLENQETESCMKEIRERFDKYSTPFAKTLLTKYSLTKFPFEDIKRYDDIKMPSEMTLDQYAGMLRSAHVTHLYDRDNADEEPIVEQARRRLKATLGENQNVRLKTSWTVFMILGRKD